jgi:hypothetical protein
VWISKTLAGFEKCNELIPEIIQIYLENAGISVEENINNFSLFVVCVCIVPGRL